MKLLFDQNISHRVIALLQNKFPEVKHVKDFNLQFSTDRQIWNYAKEHHFDIVTFDADFYDLVTLLGHPPKVIWLRIGNTSTQNLAKVIEHHYDVISSFVSDVHYQDISCLEINE